jgi:CheY-like chemotaxis protein
MSAPTLPEPLTVVVVSSDTAFRRLAGAALSQAGHEVHTATAAPLRIGRLIRFRRPQALILDATTCDEIAAAETACRAGGVHLVVVADGMPGVVEKWGPLDALLAEVEAPGPAGPSRLRVVADDH